MRELVFNVAVYGVPLLLFILLPVARPPVRRLAVLCLKNGSPQRDTILILESLGDNDEQPKDLRQSARKVADLLRRKSR